MELIDKIYNHFSKYGKNPEKIRKNSFSIDEEVDERVKAKLVFSEIAPRHILGYTSYLPKLEGKIDKVRQIDSKLLNRNSHIVGVNYAKTDKGFIIVKGDFHASDEDEVAMRQSEDLWLDIRGQLKNLPKDLALIKRKGLKIKGRK